MSSNSTFSFSEFLSGAYHGMREGTNPRAPCLAINSSYKLARIGEDPTGGQSESSNAMN